jgi:tRNA-Thr(GGU) m(6)t(6)A37 methyltransferase TsaA
MSGIGGYELRPIGFVHSTRAAAEDDAWGEIESRIELDPEVVDEDATLGLAAFSHVEVVFVFHRVSGDEVCRGARHPRDNEAWPRTGILAQRAKDRPNRIGTTICRLLSVAGYRLEVAGLDAIDGTPVLDIKPFMSGFAPRGRVVEPEWAKEIMSEYW